jgi:hypothetical protein
MSRLSVGLAIVVSIASAGAVSGQAASSQTSLTPKRVAAVSRNHGYRLIREVGHVWVGPIPMAKELAYFRAPISTKVVPPPDPGALLEVIVWPNRDLARRAAIWESHRTSSDGKGTSVRNVTLIYFPSAGGRVPLKVARLITALATA